MDVHSISTKCTRTEFVGTAVLDTIGLVISGVDDTLLKEMNIGTRYHTLGLFSSRTGAAGQITAVDDEDWEDEANWYKVNPSLGYTVDIERLRDAYRKAKQNPADEITFKWLRMNLCSTGAASGIRVTVPGCQRGAREFLCGWYCVLCDQQQYGL